MRLCFSKDLEAVIILPRRIEGTAESNENEWPRVYQLGETLFAGGQFEQPVDGPQNDIARHGSDHSVLQRYEGAPDVDQQAQP